MKDIWPFKSKKNNTEESDVDMIEVHTPSFFSRHFLHILVLFGVGFLIFTFIFQIYFRPIYIVGVSMQPTINASASVTNMSPQDLVYYVRTNSYSSGDIVIADFSGYLPSDETVIKRIVATPGQTIVFTNLHNDKIVSSYSTIEYTMQVVDASGNVVLDMATEDYINKETRYYLTDYYVKYYYEHPETEIYAFFVELYTTLSLTGEYRYTIQSDEYFLMGDNRNNSTDSRMVGPVKKSDLLGKMEILIPYGTNFFVGIWKALFA